MLFLGSMMNAGFQDTAVELKEVIALTGKANEHIEYALRRTDNRKEKYNRYRDHGNRIY